MSKEITADHLRTLTVPQLKAICKEKKITAYSKLQKNAIVQKILDHRLVNSSPLQETVCPGAIPSNHRPVGAIPVYDSTHDEDNHQPLPTSLALSGTQPMISDLSKTPPSSSLNAAPSSLLPSPNALVISGPTNTLKKRVPDHLDSSVLSKKRKPTTVPGTSTIKSTLENLTLSNVPDIPSAVALAFVRKSEKTTLAPSRLHQKNKPAGLPPTKNTIAPVTTNMAAPIDASVLTKYHKTPTLNGDSTKMRPVLPVKTPKRFVPLAINKAKTSKVTANIPQVSPIKATDLNTMHNPRPLSCLESFDFPDLVLHPITLPPSLSQRKCVTRLAIILSAVSVEDLPNLVQVSRLYRYAAYVSATYRLLWGFPGRRLADLMKKHPTSMTNMWPYLRQRERERATREYLYHRSFLGKALKGHDGISNHLWTSPDNVKQVLIAARFLLTRLFFSISVGSKYFNSKGIVTDAQELVDGEIWSVTISCEKRIQVFYVLEATCEVVGHPPWSPTESLNLLAVARTNALSIRADWSAYINEHISPSATVKLLPLLEHLKWTNHEEYDRGISKLWLNKIQRDGELGTAKRVVAERYVLACIVGNSVSGRWMSSTEMAQDFNGLSSRVDHPKECTRVHLFLPAHHHVESVHFMRSDGSPFHFAIASVQTPVREYFILKDNGMQIGCEEDGIAQVWMETLGCDASGIAKGC